MFNNYLKTAIRFISRNLSFTLINLIGLTAGIAAFLLIALHLQEQLTFDRHIPNPERTFRLVGIQEPAGLDHQHVAYTSGAWLPYILENIPQVEDAFRIFHTQGSVVEVEDKVFRETEVYFADRNILHYMGLSVLKGGDPSQMLAEPNQAVISRATAEKFYNTIDVIGRGFEMDNRNYMITGVFENENVLSHLHFEILLSVATVETENPWILDFRNNMTSTYIILNSKEDAPVATELINAWQNGLYEEDTFMGMMRSTFYLQNIKDIYLRSGHLKFHIRTNEGSISRVYIFSVIAVLIILIACINFINLSTAHSAKRFKEVGMRKMLGADRRNLALQFIGESMIITLIAIVLSLGFVELFLPWYNAVLGTDLEIDFLGNPLFNIGLVGIWVFVGTISGLYPALYLSRFEPIMVLKAGGSAGKPRTATLRKILVIIQFAISTAMIFATAVVMHQVNYMHNRDLGFNPEGVVSIFHSQNPGYEQIRGFRNTLLSLPEISHAGISSGHNGVAGRQSFVITDDSISLRLMSRWGYVDPDFFPAMDINITQGRNFSHDYATDPNRTMIINRAAALSLGFEDPVGKRIVNYDDEEIDYFTIIGVIEDYHYYSLHNPIEPAVYVWRPEEMRVTNLRYRSQEPARLMQQIEKEFNEYFPGHYFMARHLPDLLHRQYRGEMSALRIFMAFAILCIVISCLGLFGLTSFMITQKKKEISIRKVLGGTILQINLLLMRNFIKWVVLAAIIAFPVAWLFMERWLSNYAYRIEINAAHIILSLLLVTLIAVTTIAGISTRAAMDDPSNAIKYE